MPTRTLTLEPARWTVWVAWGAFFSTSPSAVWRVLMIVGLMPGTQDLRQFELAGDAALGYGYVFALSIIQLTAGFLTVGLIRLWGERFRGRRVPLAPVLLIATLGGLTVIWLFDISLVGALVAGQRPDAGLVSGAPLALMLACYTPILWWGPLELAATLGYWMRRRRPHALSLTPGGTVAARNPQRRRRDTADPSRARLRPAWADRMRAATAGHP